MIRYSDRVADPGELYALAEMLHNLDPAVLDYHVAGKLPEFLNDFDIQTILSQITCPLLLLQAQPDLGSMLTKRAVEVMLSSVTNTVHVVLDNVGHDLGLDSGNVAPLLKAVSSFLMQHT